MSETTKEIGKTTPLIGAHTSTQGGLHNGLLNGAAIGATNIQIFTSNQRQWSRKPLYQAALDMWHHTLEHTGIREVMSHASYLVNLGSNQEAILNQSRANFLEEIERCLSLKISYLNFHPGAAKEDSPLACLDRIVESLKRVEPLFQGETTLRLLLETTAGQGSVVGHSFEQLAYLIDRVKQVVPIGVCMDTCHIFTAGYDIRTASGWEETLAQFDSIVGLDHLYALHVNDSMMAFGSRKDRHANLGEGKIGIDSFKIMMQHPKLKYLPLYLETPNGEKMWEKEIAWLRSFY